MIVLQPNNNISVTVSILPENNQIASVTIRDTEKNKDFPIGFNITPTEIYTKLELSFNFIENKSYILTVYDANNNVIYISNILCTKQEIDNIKLSKYNDVLPHFEEHETNNEFLTI